MFKNTAAAVWRTWTRSWVFDDPSLSRASFVVSSPNIYGWTEIKAKMEQRLGDALQFDTRLSALSLIGEGLNRDNATLTEAVTLLEQHGIPIAGVTTTSFRISLLVPRPEIDQSVRLCHDQWVAGTRPAKPPGQQ